MESEPPPLGPGLEEGALSDLLLAFNPSSFYLRLHDVTFRLYFTYWPNAFILEEVCGSYAIDKKIKDVSNFLNR